MHPLPVARSLASGRTRSHGLGGILLAANAVAACHGSPDATVTLAQHRAVWPSPASDPTPTCTDVSDLRVCWGKAKPVVLPRPVPPAALSALGWRCTGQGASRTCVDRARDAALFRCEAARCVQSHPRLPDDGEWECADMAGIVVCRGGERPAGTPRGASDPGFFCGPRHGSRAAPGERICVDPSPDFPEASARGLRCHYEATPGVVRVCERAEGAHVVTDGCDAQHPCVSGLDCVAARCVPRAPEPACWLDADCEQGICRFGTCTEGVP